MSRDKQAVVISGPSGAGKTEIVKAVLLRAQKEPRLFGEWRIGRVVTSTTRLPRPEEGERHGEHYFFWSEEEFLDRIVRNCFLEHVTSSNGCQYGAEHEAVESVFSRDEIPFLNLDLEGALAMKSYYRSSWRIFIMPGRFEDLEKRMKGRDKVEERLCQAKIDIERWRHYCNCVVFNHDGRFEETVDAVISEIQKYLVKK